MRRSLVGVCVIAAAGLLGTSPANAQGASPFNGVWTLNRALSDPPREIGFDVSWLPSSAGGQSGRGGGGRGRRGSGGGTPGSGGVFYAPREGYEDARRVQLLTAEARNPPVRLMVVDTPASVTITNELGQSRILHPDGKEESIEVQGVNFPVTTKREGDRLVATYRVAQGREVRYTYSYSASPRQLVVDVQFLERGAGDKARRVYEPGTETQTLAPPAPADVPASPGQQAGTFDGRPGAELRGLKSLGILVEDLSPQAVACGLNHDAIETALAKRLTDAGFSVRRSSDDDTYLYVNVMTTNVPSGTCVSRYDVFLYTHATANLSYRDKPVLVQVSLMHRGGIGTSAPAAHAAAVSRGLEGYVDVLVAQIRSANQ